MKFVAPRPFADAETAARKLVELANAFEPIQDGRIYIEKINGPFLFELRRRRVSIRLTRWCLNNKPRRPH
jgi:hypothetical protein